MCTCKYSAVQFLIQSNVQKFKVLSRSWEVLDHVAIAWLLEFQCRHFECSNIIKFKFYLINKWYLPIFSQSSRWPRSKPSCGNQVEKDHSSTFSIPIHSSTLVPLFTKCKLSAKIGVTLYKSTEWQLSVPVWVWILAPIPGSQDWSRPTLGRRISQPGTRPL